MTGCATCGREVAEHDRHVRFRLPEPVLRTELQDRAPEAWLSHGDATASVMMQVPPLGAFVRALLPVSLTGGHTVTFGVWVGLHPDDLQRAARAWWKPDYANLRLDGLLANVVAPWDMYGAPVGLAVLDPEQTPYCVSSDDPALHELLTRPWEHAAVLDALP